jgi:cytoskeleton protein RodZ
MSQLSFGEVLREARERKGLDIQSVSRRLRVRPDILRSIEESDFSRLPARGYTRNMISAYARMVGLNASAISDMYLDQLNLHQVRLERNQSESPAYVSGRRSVGQGDARGRRSSRGRDAQGDEDGRSRKRGDDVDVHRSSRRRPQDDEYERDPRSSRRGQGAGRGHSGSSRGGSVRSSRSRSRDNFEGTLAVRAAQAEGRSRRVGNSAVGSQLGNMYSGSVNTGGAGNQRTIVIIAIAVILILLVIVFALIFGNRGGATQQETAKVPITGVTDTSADGSGTSESQQTQQTTQVTVPTSVTVEYKLAKGSDAYVVITQDGTETQSMLSGPVSETVQVSGTWSLATYVSDAFTITMDGKAVEFTTDSNSGMPTATVNFQDYLATWADEHPDVKVDLGTSGSSTSTTASTSTSTGSTSSGTTSTGTSSTASGTSSMTTTSR